MKSINPLSMCAVLALALPTTALTAEFKFPAQTFTVPDGFEVELVAAPPVVERPISASFDEQGRLYVTDSSGSNDKVEKQLAEKPHRVRRLDPADALGRFTAGHIFAGQMMFPEGCLWFDGSLYVAAPPSIWKLTDTDGDGAADRREEWHQGKTLTGCANDLHGPYLGLDGWIYWCKGAFARQTYERPGRPPIVTRASHIFRAPASHADLEPVLTAGMDNPVGVVFTSGGERFMCGTFLMHPEAGKRDGIVHAIYGGVYGKPNDVTDDHPKTGDLMPIMTHLGPAAPCSIIRYESEAFGPEYRNSLFVCCFNLHKVTRHVLEPAGATFTTKDTDFLVSDNPDFHPTDVIEDADGSLLVVDTGGWYKLCCPTSQLSKPDVLGAIYRIRRRDARSMDDPRGLKLDWDHMDAAAAVKLLADSRPAVRKRAIHHLARLGPGAAPALAAALRAEAPALQRCNAVWALTRLDSPEARAAVRSALADSDETVIEAAIHSASLWRDGEAEAQLLALLESGRPALQRAAAEALGRTGNRAAVAGLLAVAAQPCDRVLEHSLIYALIELGDSAGTARGLNAASIRERRAALIALDQMERGGLQPAMVTPWLNLPDASLRETAVWVVGHHPDWGGALSGYFRERLQAPEISGAAAEELTHQLALFAAAQPLQELMGEQMSNPGTPAAARQILLRAMAMDAPKDPPAQWTRAVGSCLTEGNQELLAPAITAARALGQARTNAPDFSAALVQLGENENLPAALRLDALTALRRVPPLEPPLFRFLCADLDSSKPVALRGAAAALLARAKLSDAQLLELADNLRTAGPLEMSRLLAAFERSNNPEVGSKLVEALKNAKGLASLRPDQLQTVVYKYPDPVRRQGQELLALLSADSAQEKAHLEQLLASLKSGDVRRGQAVFNSPRAACSSCHAMGYLGGHVGPDLTSIGQVRTEKDLLESIVYPSASFVRSYEPYIVKTKSDEEYSGVLRKDSPDEIVVATGPNTEARIARADVLDIRPGTVSLMPAGLEQQLSAQELADLVAFLKATKWGAN